MLVSAGYMGDADTERPEAGEPDIRDVLATSDWVQDEEAMFIILDLTQEDAWISVPIDQEELLSEWQ